MKAVKKQSLKDLSNTGKDNADKPFILEDGTTVFVKNRELTTIEDSKYAVAIIAAIAKDAGRAAASEAIALKMPRVYATATKIIRESADGKKTTLAAAGGLPGKKYFKKYIPGTIMHAVKKEK